MPRTSGSEDNGATSSDRKLTSEAAPRRGFLASIMSPPPQRETDDSDARPRRPPLKWRAVFLGTGTMLLGSILLQLAIAPIATRSQLVGFTPTDSTAAVLSSGGRGPAGSAYNQLNDRVWVSNALADEVEVIGLDGSRDGTAVRVGKAPVAVAVDAKTGNVVVANSGSNDVSVVSRDADSVTATIGSGENPAGVAIAPGARRAYVTNLKSGDVSVIDLDTKVVLARIPVGKEPQAIAVDGLSERVFVAATGDNEIKAIEPSTGSITGTVRTSSAPIALASAPDGSLIAALFQDKQLVVIDPATMTITRGIGLPSRPTSVAVNPASGVAVVASSESSQAYVVDTAAGTVSATIALGISPSSITVNPATNTYFAYGAVPIPTALNIVYIALLFAVVCLGGFVAGFLSKKEPVRHASFALGGLALVVWLVLAGGRIEALFAVAFSAAFALPLAALGGFLAGRKTGEIEEGLRATIRKSIGGRASPQGGGSGDSSEAGVDITSTSGKELSPDEHPAKKRRYRREVDSRDSDEALD